MVPIIKPEFAFFQVQVKGCSRDSVEFLKSSFGKRPERFDSIYMGFSTGEFISSMTYTIMLFIAHINQTVMPAPLVGMNNRIRIDLSADNCLEGLLGTVG